MGYLHRHSPAGLIAVVLGVWLPLSACTGGTAAAPTSETPLTPRGSLVDETPPSTSSETSGSPGPSSTPGSERATSSSMPGSEPVTSLSRPPSVRSMTTTSGPTSAKTPASTSDSTVGETSSRAATTAASATSRPSATALPPATSWTPSTGSNPIAKAPPPASTANPSRSTGVETVIMNAEEIATRKEIEQAWLRYWDIYVAFNRVPKEQRPARFGAVAMDPELADLLRAATIADEKAIENYGTVSHRIYWGPPVAGKTTAVIGDCTDQTKFGVRNRTTGRLAAPAGSQGDYNGTLQKVDGTWKVSYLDFRGGGSCLDRF